MKNYKRFVILFFALFILYAVMKISEPKETDWTITLQSDDKNPFGTYIFYHSLDSLFPQTGIETVRKPFYNFFDEIYDNEDSAAVAYFAVAPALNFSKAEMQQLFSFIGEGNYVFLSAENFQGTFFDSLHLRVDENNFTLTDSSVLNFINPKLKSDKGFSYRSAKIGYDLLDNYFDSLPKKYPTKILGVIEKNNSPDFVKIEIGKGALLVHSAPLVFSNAFLLNKNNNEYTAKALSYLPSGVSKIYWDNYYTQGDEGASTPFRYILNNFWLRIGFYLAWILLFLYIFFDGKRRQRVIPVIEPPRNTTYRFIKTIAELYFNKNSSNEIARKKIIYWEEFVRTHYHLKQENDTKFVADVAERSGADKAIINAIVQTDKQTGKISNAELMSLFNNIQTFYQQAKA